jgi:hypothetical protein
VSETLCACGAMRLLDPSRSCGRGGSTHAYSRCAVQQDPVTVFRGAPAPPPSTGDAPGPSEECHVEGCGWRWPRGSGLGCPQHPSPRAQTGTDEDAARIEREAYEENVRRVVTALASGNPTCTCRDPQHGDRFLRATCVGAYEDERNIGFGCDTCCGHGNEDGWCVPLRSAALRREERDPRLAALEEAARVVDGLAAHTSREDEEQRAWLYAYAKAAAAIRALSSPATNPEPETKETR